MCFKNLKKVKVIIYQLRLFLDRKIEGFRKRENFDQI